MKPTFILFAISFGMILFSCQNKNDSDNHSHDHSHSAQLLDVEVDNRWDPICEMETAGHVSDTIHYAGNVFGFCSTKCKTEFAKNPEEYLDQMN